MDSDIEFYIIFMSSEIVCLLSMLKKTVENIKNILSSRVLEKMVAGWRRPVSHPYPAWRELSWWHYLQPGLLSPYPGLRTVILPWAFSLPSSLFSTSVSSGPKDLHSVINKFLSPLSSPSSFLALTVKWVPYLRNILLCWILERMLLITPFPLTHGHGSVVDILHIP